MHEVDIRKEIAKEKRKITKALRDAKIQPHKMKTIEATIDNVAMMKVKLDEMRELLIPADPVVEYDNGGGQKGVRENPVFKRYESFFKTYELGIDAIFGILDNEEGAGNDMIDDSLRPKTVLGFVEEKRRDTA